MCLVCISSQVNNCVDSLQVNICVVDLTYVLMYCGCVNESEHNKLCHYQPGYHAGSSFAIITFIMPLLVCNVVQNRHDSTVAITCMQW